MPNHIFNKNKGLESAKLVEIMVMQTDFFSGFRVRPMGVL